MTTAEAPAPRALPGAVRLLAWAVVGGCAAVFLLGLVLWARQSSLAGELWALPGTWTEDALRQVAAEAGIPITVVSAFVMLCELILALAGVAAAALLLRGRPTWFRAYVAVALAVWVTLGGAMAVVYGEVVGQWATGVQGVGWVAVFPMLYLFPDGRFVPAWSRWLVLAWAAYLPALGLLWLLGVDDDPDGLLQVVPILVLFASTVWAGIHRYRRVSTSEQRRQTRGLLTAVVLWLAVAVVSVATPLRGWREEATPVGLLVNGLLLLASYLALALIPLAIAVAILRYRLFAVDVWVARSLVYSTLTLILVTVYAALGALGGLWWPGDSLAGPLVAVVVIAVVLHPLRVLVQRRVDRFVYGHSLQPKALLASVLASRERILVAREEERQRLQRDLHDQLGPTLASLYQRVEAARWLVGRDPAAAERLLADVGTQTKAAIADIRGLVQALRPPELDQLGLVESIAAAANRFDGVSVAVQGAVGEVPTVVEIAAYRIATEAATNAVRHGRATNVRVTLAEEGSCLVVTVLDDGRGMPLHPVPGTGMRSMRDRADELGGSLDVSRAEDGGTIVRAVLPQGGYP